MHSRFFKKSVKPLLIGTSFIICIYLCPLLQASDLPSGLPKDLSDNSAYEPCLGTFCGAAPPRCPWYFSADALFLKRDRIDRVPVAALTLPENIVFSTYDLSSPFRASPKFMLGHNIGDTRWQIDFTYFWTESWDDNAAIRDSTINPYDVPGDLYSPFTNFGDPKIPGYDYNNYVSIQEFSQLRNGELNLRYTLPMPHECLTPKLIIGLRYTDMHEQFDYLSQSNVSPPDQLGLSSTAVSTRTTNDLFGPQLGGEFYFYAAPRCWIDFEFKGAICNNRALQETTGTLTDDGVDTPVYGRRSTDVTAFVGDLDLMLVWQITPRLLTRIGYQAIFVNNIAMAARNFSPSWEILENGPPQINTDGRAVYHGPHIGLEFTW
jgi:hypothetical protein